MWAPGYFWIYKQSFTAEHVVHYEVIIIFHYFDQNFTNVKQTRENIR